VKGKVVPVLNEAPHIKTYWRSGDIAPRILDLGSSRRWVVSLTPRPLYPQGKSPRYPLVDRRLGWSKTGSSMRTKCLDVSVSSWWLGLPNAQWW